MPKNIRNRTPKTFQDILKERLPAKISENKKYETERNRKIDELNASRQKNTRVPTKTPAPAPAPAPAKVTESELKQPTQHLKLVKSEPMPQQSNEGSLKLIKSEPIAQKMTPEQKLGSVLRELERKEAKAQGIKSEIRMPTRKEKAFIAGYTDEKKGFKVPILSEASDVINTATQSIIESIRGLVNVPYRAIQENKLVNDATKDGKLWTLSKEQQDEVVDYRVKNKFPSFIDRESVKDLWPKSEYQKGQELAKDEKRETMRPEEKVYTDLKGVVGSLIPIVIGARLGAGQPTIFLQSAGRSMQEAIDEGFDSRKAFDYGILSGAATTAINSLNDYIPGQDIFKGKLAKMSGNLAKDASKIAMALTVNAGEEGGEEILEYVADFFLQRYILDKKDEQFNTKEMLYSGILGALGSIVVGGTTSVPDLQRSQQIRTKNKDVVKAFESKARKDIETHLRKITATVNPEVRLQMINNSLDNINKIITVMDNINKDYFIQETTYNAEGKQTIQTKKISKPYGAETEVNNLLSDLKTVKQFYEDGVEVAKAQINTKMMESEIKARPEPQPQLQIQPEQRPNIQPSKTESALKPQSTLVKTPQKPAQMEQTKQDGYKTLKDKYANRVINNIVKGNRKGNPDYEMPKDERERKYNVFYQDAQNLLEAIDRKDFKELLDRLHRGNDSSLKLFSEITDLPTTSNQVTKESIRSLAPKAYDDYILDVKKQRQVESERIRQEEQIEKEKGQRESLEKIENKKINSDGKIITLKQWIQDLIGEGFVFRKTNEYGGWELAKKDEKITPQSLKKSNFSKEEIQHIKDQTKKFEDEKQKNEELKEQEEYNSLSDEGKASIDSLFQSGGTKTPAQPITEAIAEPISTIKDGSNIKSPLEDNKPFKTENKDTPKETKLTTPQLSQMETIPETKTTPKTIEKVNDAIDTGIENIAKPFKPAKFKKETIQILKNVDGAEQKVPVFAETYKGLAVHGDAVTHIQSGIGIAIGRIKGGKAKLKEFAQRMADSADMTADIDSVRDLFYTTEFKSFYEDTLKFVNTDKKTGRELWKDELTKLTEGEVSSSEVIKILDFKNPNAIIHGFDLEQREQLITETLQQIGQGKKTAKVDVYRNGIVELNADPAELSRIMSTLRVGLKNDSKAPVYTPKPTVEEELASKEYWKITADDFYASYPETKRGLAEFHRNTGMHTKLVFEAMAKGKTVPQSVKDSIPDFNKKWEDYIENIISGEKSRKDTAERKEREKADKLKREQEEKAEADKIKKQKAKQWENELINKTLKEHIAGRRGPTKELMAYDHREAVKKAISEGRKVPSEVLKDYPDLAPKEPQPQPKIEDKPKVELPKTIDLSQPYNSIDSFRNKLSKGEEVSLDSLKEYVEFVITKEQAIKEDLNKLTINELKKEISQSGAYYAEKKADYINTIYEENLSSIYFNVTGKDSYTTSSFGKDYLQEKITRINEAIESLTPEKWEELQNKVKEEYEARVKSYKERIEKYKNPETLEELREKKRIAKLSKEEQLKYDELYAIDKKAKRESKKTEKKNLSSETIGEYSVVKDKDTRDNSDLWVIKLGDRVDKDTFNQIRNTFKSYGIGYSSFKKGFISKTVPVDALKQITGEQPIDIKPVQVKDNASKLDELADNMQSSIDDLRKDRLVNTAKRANEAANAESRAENLEEIQNTLRNLAEATRNGELKLLDTIDSRAQITTLNSVLSRAKYKLAQENKIDRYEKALGKVKNEDAVERAELPQATINSNMLEYIIKEIDGKKGYILIADRFKKLLKGVDGYKQIQIPENLRVDLEKVIKEKMQGRYVEDELNERKRFERMGIESVEELRAYLREYIKYVGKKNISDSEMNVKRLERNLIGRKFEGYFPTPSSIVNKMLDYAEIQSGDKILEPSAGKGNIADLIKSNVSDANIDVIEIQPALREILTAKNYNLVGSDFIKHEGNYDKIIMNPPFENLQDVDHVRHAYELLNDGGRLVAITSESPFFRSDKKAVEFRDWLDSVGGTSEKLPEGSFKSSDRPTGVNTRMVVIDKASVGGSSTDLDSVEKQFKKEIDSKEKTGQRGRVTLGKPKNIASEIIKGSDEDVAKQFMESKTFEPSLAAKIKDALTEFKKQAFRGAYPELERGPKWADLRADLLRQEAVREISMTKTIQALQGLRVGLTYEEAAILDVLVVFSDLKQVALKEMDLPFNLTGLKQIERILSDAEIKSDKMQVKAKVKEYQGKRKDFLRALANELIRVSGDLGFNIEDRFKNEDYFHHMVIEHISTKNFATGTGDGIRVKTSPGYLKRRKGSTKNIISDVITADAEVIAQMYYDIETAKFLKKIKDSKHNIRKGLEKEAKMLNKESMEQLYNAEARDSDGSILVDGKGNRNSKTEKEMKKYKQYIAMSFSNLQQLAKDGLLWEGDKGQYADVVSQIATGKKSSNENSKTFKFISELSGRDNLEGFIQAKTILKYVAKQEQQMRLSLGNRYVEWNNIIPDGYETYQPVKGEILYTAYTVPEQAFQKLIERASDEVTITAGQVKEILAKGARRYEMVIPSEVAITLRKTVKNDTGIADKLFRYTQTKWKQNAIMSPRRLGRFMIRNTSGDLDSVLSTIPGVLDPRNGHLGNAINYLYKTLVQNKSMHPELQEWFEEGGLNSLFQVQEVGEIRKLKIFLEQTQGKDYNVIKKYFRFARLTNDFRESILRLATYMYVKEQHAKGNMVVGGAQYDEVLSIKDPKRRAFWVSNKTIGDYADMSPMTKELAAKWVPFFKFQEQNFVKTVNIIRNAIHYDPDMLKLGEAVMSEMTKTGESPFEYIKRKRLSSKGSTKRTASKITRLAAIRIGRMAMGLLLFESLVQLWNLRYKDEIEEKLSNQQRNKLFVYLGTDSQGNPIIFDRVGVIRDFFEWFGMSTIGSDIEEMYRGNRTFKEQIIHMAKQPVNKVANQSVPLFKLAFELSLGRSSYPDPWNPKTIRNKGQYLANQLGFKNEYEKLKGMPSIGYSNTISDLFLYRVDYKQSAYFDTLDKKRNFQKDVLDKNPASGFFPDKKANAIYYYKLALRYGDETAAEKYLQEYEALGGTKEGYERSMAQLSPTYGLGANRQKFIDSLSGVDESKFEIAMEFYKESVSKSNSLFVDPDLLYAKLMANELTREYTEQANELKEQQISAIKENINIKPEVKANLEKNLINVYTKVIEVLQDPKASQEDKERIIGIASKSPSPEKLENMIVRIINSIEN